MTAGAIHERGFPIFENLRRAHLVRKRRGRGRLGFDAKDFDLWFEGFDCAGYACDETAAADTSNDRCRVWRIFKNFKSHGAVTGDEIVIVERMNKCSLRSGK